MKIIISILHYRNVKDTLDCLKSLQKIDKGGHKIKTIVIDNSQDNLLNLDEFDDLDLKLIKNEKNLGFTGGHNSAYRVVKDEDYDVFLLLNNDCIVDSDFLPNLLKPLEVERVAGTVPKIYFSKGNEYHKNKYKSGDLGRVIWFAGGKMNWDMVTSEHLGLDEVDSGQYDKEREIDFATGACFAIKKEVLDKIGLFDDNYFLYFEDADLSMRIISVGYKILYVPDSIVWHKNAGSSGSGSNLHDYYLTRNRIYFGMKYASFKMKALLLSEAARLLVGGRVWQKIGVWDYFFHKLGKGSFNP